MRNDRKEFEILAPAGSREAMAAAVAAGADAVYFGLGALDMRSLATGAFGEADLPDIAAFAKDHNLKTRLTVNAVLYDEDLAAARQTMLAAKKAGIDAVICSDVAAMMLAHEVGIPVHLSTQLNIANVEALKFYARFADVAVLARELTLEQTAAITRAIDEQNICGPSGKRIKIEIFCHGALCIAQSGRCFMSLHTRGKSANRGQCLQSCRRKYYIKDAERDIELQIDPQYVMSPKDLKTIGFSTRWFRAARAFSKSKDAPARPNMCARPCSATARPCRRCLTATLRPTRWPVGMTSLPRSSIAAIGTDGTWELTRRSLPPDTARKPQSPNVCRQVHQFLQQGVGGAISGAGRRLRQRYSTACHRSHDGRGGVCGR